MKADIGIINHGSIVTLTPKTKAGREWLAENVQAEDWQWVGPSVCIEPRYVEAIMDGAINDGLRIAV